MIYQFGFPTDFVWHYTYHSPNTTLVVIWPLTSSYKNSTDYIAHEQQYLTSTQFI